MSSVWLRKTFTTEVTGAKASRSRRASVGSLAFTCRVPTAGAPMTGLKLHAERVPEFIIRVVVAATPSWRLIVPFPERVPPALMSRSPASVSSMTLSTPPVRLMVPPLLIVTWSACTVEVLSAMVMSVPAPASCSKPSMVRSKLLVLRLMPPDRARLRMALLLPRLTVLAVLKMTGSSGSGSSAGLQLAVPVASTQSTLPPIQVMAAARSPTKGASAAKRPTVKWSVRSGRGRRDCA